MIWIHMEAVGSIIWMIWSISCHFQHHFTSVVGISKPGSLKALQLGSPTMFALLGACQVSVAAVFLFPLCWGRNPGEVW